MDDLSADRSTLSALRKCCGEMWGEMERSKAKKIELERVGHLFSEVFCKLHICMYIRIYIYIYMYMYHIL